MAGKIIVVEGLDGAGKSSQIGLLKERIAQRGRECEYVHFPRLSGGFFGEMIAGYLRGELGSNDEVNPYLAALMFAMDRADFKNVLNEWLDKDKIIVLDRYVDSNAAFQCAKLNSKPEREKLRKWIYRLEYEQLKLPKPALSIFIDRDMDFISRNLSKERKGEDRDYLSGKRDIHESSIGYQERVRSEYLGLVGMGEMERAAAPKSSDASKEEQKTALFKSIWALIEGKGIL